MADILLRPVDFDPFAAGPAAPAGDVKTRFEGYSAASRAAQPARDAERLAILKTEERDHPDDPNLKKEIAHVEGARGSKIAGEARGRRGPLFPVNDTPKVSLVPVDGDPFAAAQPERGEFAKGFVGGLTGGTPKMTGSAIQGAGVVLGSDWLKEQGAQLAKAGQDTLAGFNPKVGSIAQVRTDGVGNALSDFFTKYLPYQTGNALSSMVPTILTGLLGAAAGFAAAGPGGAAVGGLGGVVLSGYPLNYGDIHSAALEDNGIQGAVKAGRLTERDVAAVTMVAAVPISALDAWSIGRLGSALTAPVKKAIYQRIFAEMAKGSLREGSTEGLQQIISEVVQQGLGSDKTLKDAAVAVTDSAIGGMAGGGVTGGFAGAIQRAPSPPVAAPFGGAQPVGAPQEGGTEAPGLPREAAQAVAGGFHVEPPPGSQIPAVPYTSTDIELGRAEGATGAQQAKDEGAIARELAGGIDYQHPVPAAEGASPLEQARLDAQILQQGGSLVGADPQRVRNATLVSVYGENNAVRHAIENPELSGVGDAMLAVAPMVERVRATIQEGERNRDITQDIVGAVDELAVIRAGGQDPAQVIAHGAKHDLSYESQQLLQFLDENQGNPQALASFMERYLEIVQDMGGVPSQVRGRAFDIIQERNASRRLAQQQADAVVKEQAFKETEQVAQRQKRVEEAKAREEEKTAAAQRHVAVGEAAAGGPAPETAMADAFKNAKPLRSKRGQAAGPVSGTETGSAQAGAREPRAEPKSGAGRVPESAETRDARDAQPVRARGGEAGPETRVDQIAAERKTAELLASVMVTTRAIDAKTGKRVKVTERASDAMKSVNHQIQMMEALLECLG